MTDEVPEPIPPLTAEEQAAAATLTSDDFAYIDSTILSCTLLRWQKVAMVISRAMDTLEPRYPVFSSACYAQRVQILADEGRLEAKGDLDYIRFSEVRLPNEGNHAL